MRGTWVVQSYITIVKPHLGLVGRLSPKIRLGPPAHQNYLPDSTQLQVSVLSFDLPRNAEWVRVVDTRVLLLARHKKMFN